MPKYLLLKHYRGGPEPHHPFPPMDQWAPEDVEAHMAFLRQFREMLEENGEYVGAQALTPRGFELQHHGLVSLHHAELSMTHDECPDRRSARYGCCRGIELHHADLTKEVVWPQDASVSATHEHVHLAVREQEEGMVARSLGDERGAGWNEYFVHLGGEELQVNVGET